MPSVPGYHVPFSERIKQETGIPIVTVGLITDARQAEGYPSGNVAAGA